MKAKVVINSEVELTEELIDKTIIEVKRVIKGGLIGRATEVSNRPLLIDKINGTVVATIFE